MTLEGGPRVGVPKHTAKEDGLMVDFHTLTEISKFSAAKTKTGSYFRWYCTCGVTGGSGLSRRAAKEMWQDHVAAPVGVCYRSARHARARAELIEDLEWLLASNSDADRVFAALKISRRSLQRRLQKMGRYDLSKAIGSSRLK